MKIRTLIVTAALTALAAAPAFAITRRAYDITYQQEVWTPVGTSVFPHGTHEGPQSRAVLTDDGVGGVTIESLTIHNNLKNTFDASGTTGIPGSTATTRSDIKFRPGTPVTGAGTLFGGPVTFGTIGGWARTGQIYCTEDPVGSNGCALGSGLVHGAWAPGPPMAPTHNTDGWVFAGDASSFQITPFITTFTTLGGLVFGRAVAVTGTQTLAGAPGLLPLGVAALGASLSYVGARSLRRRKSD